jgi:hypothetical protein
MQFIAGFIVGVIVTLVFGLFGGGDDAAAQAAAQTYWLAGPITAGGSFILALILTLLFVYYAGVAEFPGAHAGIVISFLVLWLAVFVATNWALSGVF